MLKRKKIFANCSNIYLWHCSCLSNETRLQMKDSISGRMRTKIVGIAMVGRMLLGKGTYGQDPDSGE